MAKLTVSPPDDFIKALEKMGKLDEIAPRMLNAGIEPIAKAVKKNLQKHSQSGALVDSVIVGKPKKNKEGIWTARVTFKGYDKKTKVANQIKAIALEYGTSDQSATPFIRPAVIETEKESVQAMQDIFEFECQLDKIKV